MKFIPSSSATVPNFASDAPSRAAVLRDLSLPYYCINCQRKADTVYLTPNFGPFCAECVKELETHMMIVDI